MTLPLILLPAMAGIAAFFIPAPRWSRRLLLTTAVCHPALLVPFWATGLPAANTDWFQLDGIGLLFLSIISLLFLAATVSATVYLPQQASTGGHMRESTFTGCLLFFLATMSFVCLCRDFGLLWIGVEATTLASAPLIFFHRNNRSLEATWKYLLICSVGIALALMGNLFLTVSAQYALCGREASLWIPHLMEIAPRLNGPWLKAAFVFLLIGYGTKMGLAPMHTWLPDAHSEAPSLVSALLSGALLNCAFLGILRAFALCVAAGEAAFAKDLLLVLGLLSLLVAAVFILGQTDYKRMLAYSSVEHMGLLALGIGLAGDATFGAMYHVLNHSLAKAMLFLTAGNILACWKTKKARDVSGLMQIQPVSGLLWIVGFLAITGTPPFGIFFSEWIILREAFIQKQYVVAGIGLTALAVIFLGMASIMLRMAQGAPPRGAPAISGMRESKRAILPPLGLGAAALFLGLHLPTHLEHLLRAIATMLNGGAS